MKFLKDSNNLSANDPLYVIFEQHLLNFQDAGTDRKAFIGHVIKEYLGYLRKMNIIIPRALEEPVIEELATQINTMLVKKIYGCLTITEFQSKAPSKTRRKARAAFSRLSRASERVARSASRPRPARKAG